ncbi:MAG TPA: hypothetical protein VM510_02650 [Caulifigura sp.]|nr:hypothetical protein [Caulifigura sp.]
MLHGRRNCLRRLAALGASLGIPLSWTSCGALIHPERVGQPRTGRLDPGIILLDGLGLLLFLVPGLVAFIVDFATGAIYLPPDSYGGSEGAERTAEGLVKLSIPRREMTRERIEAVVGDACGRAVKLEPGSYRAEPVRGLGDYATSVAMLEQRSSGAEVVFRCQSP